MAEVMSGGVFWVVIFGDEIRKELSRISFRVPILLCFCVQCYEW